MWGGRSLGVWRRLLFREDEGFNQRLSTMTLTKVGCTTFTDCQRRSPEQLIKSFRLREVDITDDGKATRITVLVGSIIACVCVLVQNLYKRHTNKELPTEASISLTAAVPSTSHQLIVD